METFLKYFTESMDFKNDNKEIFLKKPKSFFRLRISFFSNFEKCFDNKIKQFLFIYIKSTRKFFHFLKFSFIFFLINYYYFLKYESCVFLNKFVKYNFFYRIFESII